MVEGTAQRLDELQRLAEAATPGPWFAAVGKGPKRRKQQHAVLGIASMRGTGEAGALAVFASTDGRRADNAELCAALVNAYRAGELIAADSVRALHPQRGWYDWPGHGAGPREPHYECGTCRLPWPCPTVAALNALEGR